MSRQRGFTLLELIAALGIFALMSVMAYSGLSSVLDTRRAVVAQLNRLADLQRAMHRLETDIQQARLRQIRNEFGESMDAFEYNLSGQLEFTRGGWLNPLGLPRSNLQRVRYELDGEQLMRTYWPSLDRVQDSQAVETMMIDGVTSMKWRFLDQSRKWHENWPPTVVGSTAPGSSPAPAGLPVAAELTVESSDWGELLFRFLVTAP